MWVLTKNIQSLIVKFVPCLLCSQNNSHCLLHYFTENSLLFNFQHIFQQLHQKFQPNTVLLFHETWYYAPSQLTHGFQSEWLYLGYCSQHRKNHYNISLTKHTAWTMWLHKPQHYHRPWTTPHGTAPRRDMNFTLYQRRHCTALALHVFLCY